MKKTTNFFIFVVLAIFSFGFISGCATTGDLQRLGEKISGDTADALTALEKEVADIKARPAPKDLTIPVKNLEKEVGSLQSRLEKKEFRLQGVEEEVRDAQKQLDGFVSETQSRLGVVETRVSTVEAQIKTVGVKVTSAHRTAGSAIELAGGQRYFVIDFATTEKKADAQIETLQKQMEKEGLAAVRIVGFADTTPPKGTKDEAEIRAKNEEISLTRATKVADGLTPPAITANTEIIGRGQTGQFGDKKLNRCVLVVVEKQTPAPPAAPAAIPPTPAPAPTGGLPPVPATPPAPSAPPATAAPVPAVPPATITPPVGPSPTAPPAPPLPPSLPQPAPFTPVPAIPATPATPPPAGTPSTNP